MRNARSIACAVAFALALSALLPAAPVLASQTQAATAASEDRAFPPFEPPAGLKVADPLDAATASLEAPMPVDPRITVGRLDNGLRYWIRENQYPAGRAELRLVVRVGSLQEDDDQLGLAHFVEHMAFNGTVHYPKMELVKALESFGMRFGADVNASTSFDETMYFLRIPTDTPRIVDAAFQILEDWARNVTFDAEEIDKERGVVIEEWRIGLGAGSRVRDQQFPILFADSPYAERLPIGKLEVLQSFPYEAARRFYHDWYRPDLMAVIAIGDFDATEIEARIRRQFGGLSSPDNPRERVYAVVPDHDDTRFAITTDPEATSSTVVAYHKLPLRRQAYHGSYRRSIIEGLYSRMLNRRLAEQAQQPNPPFLGARSDQGIFIPTSEVYILGAAVPDGGVTRGIEAMFAEVERVARFGFTQSELDREKGQLMRGFERIYLDKEAQDSANFAAEFTRAFLEGESTPGIDYEWALYQRFLPAITLQDVNAVSGRWINESNRVVLVTAPDKPGLQLPSEQEMLAAFDRADDEWIRPYVDTVTDAPLLAVEPDGGALVTASRVEELDLTEWRLSNGVRVILMPTDFRQDQILFRAFSPGGTSLASDEDLVAAESATQVISASGFGGFSAREITNMLAGKVVNVRPIIAPHAEGLIGNGSPRDIETLLQLIHLTFTEPRAGEGVFRVIQQQMRAGLANRDVSPEVAFQEMVQRTMSQDHVRRRPISLKLVDEMNLMKSFDFYTDRFADASDFTFVFVGNLDLEALEPLVVKYLGGLPSIGRQESWRDEGVRPPTGVVRKAVYKGLEPKSLTTIVFSGASEFDSHQRSAIAAMAELMQTRLREVLREDLGGTYGVRVSTSTALIPEPQYSISITFGSDPERVEELSEVVFAEIERLQTAIPQQQELDSVLESFRRSHELRIKENGFWLGHLVSTYQDDDDPAEILGYLEALHELTPEIIRQAATAYFNLDNVVQVSLFPESHNRSQEPLGSRP